MICSGASAFIPPVEGLRTSNNVVGLRNLEDAVLIKEQAAKVKNVVADWVFGKFDAQFLS